MATVNLDQVIFRNRLIIAMEEKFRRYQTW